jgi:hypothetical protein
MNLLTLPAGSKTKQFCKAAQMELAQLPGALAELKLEQQLAKPGQVKLPASRYLVLNVIPLAT